MVPVHASDGRVREGASGPGADGAAAGYGGTTDPGPSVLSPSRTERWGTCGVDAGVLAEWYDAPTSG